ncbi:hypothetical protein CC1G_10907 [Coprinopsis cinerea okayama7|uniref:Uncharacterized protein n=1 Tax=Coprinopsis cinerea (strain Okayama-7 / 130 / ATCC MYA-4618 / FGSC 9003) TaxID=240176 RepID=A8P5X9_COPC7|nr:hypothetical protein CC1G_10907 [Coprinopsis cinerea okayama7\|eukprot:XP_001839044.2 hypothetical protein CC1G_10907 [Coprinopsis cinerea okayama7\
MVQGSVRPELVLRATDWDMKVTGAGSITVLVLPPDSVEALAAPPAGSSLDFDAQRSRSVGKVTTGARARPRGYAGTLGSAG